jgi:hypothetical protein
LQAEQPLPECAEWHGEIQAPWIRFGFGQARQHLMIQINFNTTAERCFGANKRLTILYSHLAHLDQSFKCKIGGIYLVEEIHTSDQEESTYNSCQ